MLNALVPLIQSDNSLQVNKVSITCRSSDGFVNLTELYQAGGKLFADWKRNRKTSRFNEALSRSLIIPIDLLFACQPGLNEDRATWGYPQIAIIYQENDSLIVTIES